MIEVEIRAKLSENIQTQLEAFPNIQKDGEKKYQTDLYIKHTKDVNRDLVIRFRKTPNNVLLTFKGKSPTANDTARPEYETEIKNYEILLQILLSSGYEKLVTIDKVRERYTYNDMEINIDNIKWLGKFIEVELLVSTEEEISIAKKKIIEFFQGIWINESEIVHKWYVPLCIEAGIK